MADKDAALVRQTLAGDRNAFGDLVERYSGLVRGLVLEVIRQPDAVEDVVQDAFCKAYEELPRLQQPSKFSSWLARIAANKARDWLRRRKVRRDAEFGNQVAPLSYYNPTPEEVFDSGEMAGALWEALDRLAPEYRRLVALYHLEECSFREIARFLDMSVATVRWRLLRAQSLLKEDLVKRHYRAASHEKSSNRQLRDKIVATLPLIPLFRPPSRPTLGVWGWRGLGALGGAGVLAILGLAVEEIWQHRPGGSGREGGDRGALRVRYEPRELPAVSLLWHPRRAQRGEEVLFAAAGSEIGGDQAFLHYIGDVEYPLDRVVEMERMGDEWRARVVVPQDATALFFYVAVDGTPHYFNPRVTRSTWKKWLRCYDRQLLVCDERDLPVRGAAYAQARMARARDLPTGEIAAHLERELLRYPDHFQAHKLRWNTLLRAAADGRLAPVRRQVEREKRALRRRFHDDPEALWWTASWGDIDVYREIYQRFPDSEWADDAAYYAIMDKSAMSSDAQYEALTRFIRDFPRSPYIDDAYGDLFSLLVETDGKRAKVLADSLIERKLELHGVSRAESDRRLGRMSRDGYLAVARAYTVRFNLYLDEGNRAGMVALAKRLVVSGVEDPLPYVRIGSELAGSDTTRALGVKLLEAGLPWTTAEHMLALPGSADHSDLPDHVAREFEVLDRERANFWRGQCLLALGRAHLAQDGAEEAAKHLREAAALQHLLKRGKRDGEVHLLLGQACERTADWEGAEEAYLQLVRTFYSHPQAERALEDLHRRRYGHTAQLRERLHAAWEMAPDFRTTDARGGKVRLKSMAGRVVLIYYGSTHLQDGDLELVEQWGEEFADRGLEILYIEQYSTGWLQGRPFESEEQMAQRAAEGPRFVQYLMDDDEVYEKYELAISTLLLIDRSGRLRLFQPRLFQPHLRRSAAADRQVAEKIEELLVEQWKPEVAAGAPTESEM